MLVNWKGKSREYLKSTSFTPPRRNFHLLLNMLVNFLLLIHNLLSWVTYIQKVARFITWDTIVSVIISTRQDENCDEAAQMK
jgi:hypothetical protein